MKICISGAGIAGPALAHWLLRAGHELTLVEVAPRFRDGGYIVDFWGKGYELAERMGVLPRILDAGYRVREVRLVDEHGRRDGGFNAEIFAATLGGQFTSVPRGELAGILYDTVKNDINTLFDNRISALVEEPDGVQVSFSNAPSRRFDLVIGADGLHSGVRSLAFAPDACREHYLGYHVAAFEVAGYRPREELVYMSYGKPGKQMSRFSMRDDRTMFLLIFVADRPIEAHTADAQRAVLREQFHGLGWESEAILAAMDRAESIYFDRVSQVRVRNWSAGRVALIGDAAHCPSLMAGEGSGMAILDAYVLAGELARAAGDHRAGFLAYEQRLRGFVERKQVTAQRTAGQFAPRTAFGLFARRWGMRAMNLPGVSKLLLGRALRDEIDLPDYPGLGARKDS